MNAPSRFVHANSIRKFTGISLVATKSLILLLAPFERARKHEMSVTDGFGQIVSAKDNQSGESKSSSPCQQLTLRDSLEAPFCLPEAGNLLHNSRNVNLISVSHKQHNETRGAP